MSGYAVRNDRQGWYAVDGPENIGADEWYTEDTPPDPVPLPPTYDEQIALAMAQRDLLLTLAAIRIAPLQDAVDLDESTSDEVALLKLWKQYRIALNRVEQQAGYPAEIDWPLSPDTATNS